MELHETRPMKCKVCKKEIQINANYDIDEVTCGACWAKRNPKQAYQNLPN